jgi:hypothetical protein
MDVSPANDINMCHPPAVGDMMVDWLASQGVQ